MQSTAAFMIAMLFVCATRVVAQEDLSFEADLVDVVAEERSEALGSLVSLDDLDDTALVPDVLQSAVAAGRETFVTGDLDEDDAEATASGISVEEASVDTEEHLDVDAAPSRTLSGWVMLGVSAAATVAAMAVV